VDNHFAAKARDFASGGVFADEPEGEPFKGKDAESAVTGDLFTCEDCPLGLVCGLLGDKEYKGGAVGATGQFVRDGLDAMSRFSGTASAKNKLYRHQKGSAKYASVSEGIFTT